MKNNTNNYKLHSGLNFRIFRKILNKTQDELAEEMKVSKATISNFERGITDIKPGYLHYLYTEYGLNINWLLTGRGKIFAHREGIPPGNVQINEKLYELFELMRIPEVENAILNALKELKPHIKKGK